MGRHRLPPQQVVEIHIADLVDAGATRHQLVDPGHCAHVYRQTHQRVDDFTTSLGRGGRDRQQYLGYVMLGDQLTEILRPRHLQAMNHRALNAGIIVHEGYSMVFVTVIERGE